MTKPSDEAVSEILGALLLVVLLITGLSIIGVILLSGPPPSTGMKAILGVKCSWCPDSSPPQYDILIGHEGGENIQLNNLKLTVFTSNETKKVIPEGNITIYSPGEVHSGSIQINPPPDTCFNSPGGESWSDYNVKSSNISTGQSLKINYKAFNNSQPNAILLQEPSPFGLSTISQLKINYIQNITNTSTKTGSAGLKRVDNLLFSLVPYVGTVSSWTPDGCDVEFTYINSKNESITFPYGSTQQSMWNFVEPVSGWYSTWEVVESKSTFPAQTSGTALKLKNVKGKIIYNLGSLSTNQVTCLKWE